MYFADFVTKGVPLHILTRSLRADYILTFLLTLYVTLEWFIFHLLKAISGEYRPPKKKISTSLTQTAAREQLPVFK